MLLCCFDGSVDGQTDNEVVVSMICTWSGMASCSLLDFMNTVEL